MSFSVECPRCGWKCGGATGKMMWHCVYRDECLDSLHQEFKDRCGYCCCLKADRRKMLFPVCGKASISVLILLIFWPAFSCNLTIQTASSCRSSKPAPLIHKWKVFQHPVLEESPLILLIVAKAEISWLLITSVGQTLNTQASYTPHNAVHHFLDHPCLVNVQYFQMASVCTGRLELLITHKKILMQCIFFHYYYYLFVFCFFSPNLNPCWIWLVMWFWGL